MIRKTLFEISTLTVAIAAMIALSTNEAQAQFSLYGPYGAGIDVSRNGSVYLQGRQGSSVFIGGNRYGNFYGGNRYGNFYGGNPYANFYRGSVYGHSHVNLSRRTPVPSWYGNLWGNQLSNHWDDRRGYNPTCPSQRNRGYDPRRPPNHRDHDHDHWDNGRGHGNRR